MLKTIPWTLERTTAPTIPAVLTEELKDHLRAGDDEDSVIEAFGLAAEDAIEKELSRALLTQTWKLRLNWFPCSEIRLPRPPLASVTSVSYLESVNGTPTTLAADQYVVDTSCEPGRIYQAYGVTWPSSRAIQNAVTVTYVAGYTSEANVPSALKTAIKLLAAEMYENRERGQADMMTIWRENPTHERLIASYRIPTEFNYY